MRFTVVERWLAATLLLGSALAVIGTAAHAQTTVGNIRGYITNEAGAPVGDVQVAARNTETNQLRGTVSQASGFYFIGGLPPGRYELTARRIGMAEQTRSVQLLIGQTLEINFRLGEAAVTLAGVDVIAEQGVETKTSEIATNVTERQIDQLPTSDRNFLALATLAPGVTLQGERLGDLRKTFQVGAQGAEQINVFIDGASYKNDLLKGGVIGQDASRGNPFPLNAVQEFRILTQNYKAEYQKASSGVITTRTKSGGSSWEGSAFYNLQNEDFVALTEFQRRDRANNPNFTEPEYEREQFGFSAGGPIVERLRFFGSFERNNQDRSERVSIAPPTPGLFPALDTIDFASRAGEFGMPFESNLGFAKLTFDHTPTSTFELSYFHRDEDDIRNFGGLTAFESGTRMDNAVNTGTLRHTLARGMWLNEALVTFQRYEFNPVPVEPSVAGRLFGDFGTGCCVRIGSNRSIQDFQQDRLSLRNDLTYSGVRWGGEHVLKGGLNVDFVSYDIIKRNDEIPLFVFEPWYHSFEFPHRVEFQTGDPNFSDDNTQVGAYIQDDWSPTDRLTINLGVRWDYESKAMNYDYVTPSAVRDSISKYRDSLFVTLDESRYFTDGNDRDRYLGMLQPRIGISYALGREGRTTLFGGWGIFADRTLYDVVTLEERFALQHPRYTIFFSPPGGPPVPGQIEWDPRYLQQGKPALDELIATQQANTPEAKLLPNDLRPPMSQQFTAGIRQLLGDVAIEAAYTGVRSKNVFTFYWANENFVCPERSFQVPGCFVHRNVTGFSNVLLGDDRGKTWYDALQLKVDRRFRPGNYIGWGGGLAYTLAKRQTEGFNDEFSFPSIVDYPKEERNDERHRVVLHWIADSRFAWGVQFSGVITLGSGAPVDIAGRFDTTFVLGGFEPPKRSFIIPNAWAYRMVDLRLRKDFVNLRGSQMGVTVDLFNAFNYQNYGCFNTNPDPNNTNFGRPGCVVSDPRRLQIGVQFDYGRRYAGSR